ncbi:MAG: tetratricopeptide repeat protein [Cyanobacteria bacterium P01_H01_bin.74]
MPGFFSDYLLRLLSKKMVCTALASSIAIGLSDTAVFFSGVAYGQYRYNKPADYTATGDIDRYAEYTRQGQSYYVKGQLTNAIGSFTEALKVSPEPNLPVIYNNLAVAYIGRGNYYLNKQKNSKKALSDFRMALFYLEALWDDDMRRSALHQKNLDIVKHNINAAYKNLNITAANPQTHLAQAKALRMQGRFQEAIVEFREVLRYQSNNLDALKALGDLYTVVNKPKQSQFYYTQLITRNGSGSAAVGAENFVHLGNAQYKLGNIDDAVSNFDKALEIDANNSMALSMLEKIWLNEIKFNPQSVIGHANLGSVYQKRKQYNQAYQEYSQAERLSNQIRTTDFKTKKLIRLNMGTLFQEQRRYKPALKAYETVLQVEPNHLLANYYKATLLEETGNLGGAINAYNMVLGIDAEYEQAREKMLALIKNDPNQKRSKRALEQFGDRFVDNATIQAQIGEVFHQRKNLPEAEKFYQRAIAADANLASAWANLGAVYQEQGNSSGSIDAFNKALALEPGNQTFKDRANAARQGEAYSVYQQAVDLQKAGKTQEALPLFRQALAISDDADIHAAYGISLQSAGNYNAAIAQYQQAINKVDKTAPDPQTKAEYQYYLGTAYYQQNEYDSAVSAYRQALVLNPGYTEAEQGLASANAAKTDRLLEGAIEAYESKQYREALTELNALLMTAPDNALGHYYKGLALEAQKQLPQAINSYKASVNYDKTFTDGYYALAVALDAEKRFGEAKAAYQRFIALSGTQNDDFVEYAKARVSAL